MEKYIAGNPDIIDGGCWIERMEGKTNHLKYYHAGVAPKISWARRREQEELRLEFILQMQKEATKLGIELKEHLQPIEYAAPDKKKFFGPDENEQNKQQTDDPFLRRRKPVNSQKRDRFVM